MTDPTSHRRQTPWQFSVASLLALMTFVAIGLALFRHYPALAIGFFAAAGFIAMLLAADYFASRATRQNWRMLTRLVWAITIWLLVAIGVLVIYVVSKTVGMWQNS
jgi:hypothetical protein